MRTCTKCKEAKELDGFAKAKLGKFGRKSVCRQCLSDEYVKNRTQVRAKNAAWTEKNRDRKNATDRAYHARLVAELQEQGPEALQEFRDKVKRQSIEYRLANPEKRAKSSARWTKAHPEHVTATNHRRITERMQSPGRGVTAAEWRETLDGSLGLCAYCMQRRKLTMDHIEPRSRGGEHDVDNIAAACARCNKSKGNTPLLVWMAGRSAMQRQRAAA